MEQTLSGEAGRWPPSVVVGIPALVPLPLSGPASLLVISGSLRCLDGFLRSWCRVSRGMIDRNLQDRVADCVEVATRSCGRRQESKDSQQVAKYLRPSFETNPCSDFRTQVILLSTSGVARTMTVRFF